MYGWSEGGTKQRPQGTADADNPSQATIARRRESDIEFLAWVKEATELELRDALTSAKGWRLVAIQRRLCKFPPEKDITGS